MIATMLMSGTNWMAMMVRKTSLLKNVCTLPVVNSSPYWMARNTMKPPARAATFIRYWVPGLAVGRVMAQCNPRSVRRKKIVNGARYARKAAHCGRLMSFSASTQKRKSTVNRKSQAASAA